MECHVLFKQLPAIAGIHTVEDSVVQSILSLACINLKENNIHFSRYFPWTSLEFVSTTKRMKPDHLAMQRWRKKTNLGTCQTRHGGWLRRALSSEQLVLHLGRSYPLSLEGLGNRT